MEKVPFLLDRIVAKLLSKDKERLYQLIHEVKTDLEDLKFADPSGEMFAPAPAGSELVSPQRQILPWAVTGLLFL